MSYESFRTWSWNKEIRVHPSTPCTWCVKTPIRTFVLLRKTVFLLEAKVLLGVFHTWQKFFQPTRLYNLPFANSWIVFTLSAHCALANLLFCFFLQSNQLKVNSTGRGRISSTILWAIWNRWSWSRGVTKGKTEILPKFPRRLSGHVCQWNYIQGVPQLMRFLLPQFLALCNCKWGIFVLVWGSSTLQSH